MDRLTTSNDHRRKKEFLEDVSDSNKRRMIIESEDSVHSSSTSSEVDCHPEEIEINCNGRQRRRVKKRPRNAYYKRRSLSKSEESGSDTKLTSDDEGENENKGDTGKIFRLRNNCWRIQPVPKDGNCLFSSMAVHCEEEEEVTEEDDASTTSRSSSKSTNNHLKYRRLAVQAVINECWSSVENDVMTKLFTPTELAHINDTEDLQQAYKQKMMTTGTFGSDIEIRAAIEVLPIALTYIQKYEDDNSYRVCNFGKDLKKPRKWLLLTGPLECGHFEPLIALEEIEDMRNGLYYDAEWEEEKGVDEEANGDGREDDDSNDGGYLKENLSGEKVTKDDKNITRVHLKDGKHESRNLIKACIKVAKLSDPLQESKNYKSNVEAQKGQTIKEIFKIVQTNKKRAVCSEKDCSGEFESTATYMHHLYNNHNKTRTSNDKETKTVRWPCPFPECQTDAKNWYSIYGHFHVYHFPKEASICNICSSSFVTNSKLKRHIQTVHCQNVFKLQPIDSPLDFENLKKRTPKVQMYLADVMCPQKKNTEFICWVEGCKRSFKTAGRLSVHLTTEHREHKPYDCPLEKCGAMFSTRCKLKFHVKQSHGRRMEGMRLLPQSELDVTEPPIPCSVEGCETRFWDNTTAKRHLRDVHSEFSQYKCEWIGCEKSYKSKNGLDYHVKKFHEYFKQGSNDDALSEQEEDSDSHRYYYNGITKDQIVSHEITRLIQHRYVVQRKRFTVYFVLGFPNDLLETGLPISIPNRDWLAHLQDAENKQLTTLSLYVGSCENADISTYHTDPEKYKYSSIGQYLAEEKGKCYKVAAINCKSKEEMLTTEATAQQFIEIRYRAQTGDPNFSGGMVYEPMWTHTSVQFSMKTSDDRYDTFFNTAKNKSHNVFCLDNDCKELKHNAMAYQCHVSLELPFIGLVHVHDIFKEVVLGKK